MALLTIENQYLEQLRKAKEEEKLSFFIGSGFSTSKDPAKYGGCKMRYLVNTKILQV